MPQGSSAVRPTNGFYLYLHTERVKITGINLTGVAGQRNVHFECTVVTGKPYISYDI